MAPIIAVFILGAVAAYVAASAYPEWVASRDRERQIRADALRICTDPDKDVFLDILCQENDYAGVLAETRKRKVAKERFSGQPNYHVTRDPAADEITREIRRQDREMERRFQEQQSQQRELERQMRESGVIKY